MVKCLNLPEVIDPWLDPNRVYRSIWIIILFLDRSIHSTALRYTPHHSGLMWISKLDLIHLAKLSMITYAFLTAATAFALAQGQPSTSLFSGDITAYGAQTRGGFCGFQEDSWQYGDTMTAAINQHQQDNSLACGMCARVNRPGSNTSITVVIDNLCPECKHGDLDLSQQAWRALTGNSAYSREKAEWTFVECNQLMIGGGKGNILLRAHSANYWWIAINPSNVKCGIRSIQMKDATGVWRVMGRENAKMNGLWFILQATESEFKPPFEFKMESSIGDVVSAKVENLESMIKPIDTRVQFPCTQAIQSIDCKPTPPTHAPTPAPTTQDKKNACHLRK